MRWGNQRESDNIEDRRGRGGLAIGGGGLGILVIALAVWLCGGDPRQFATEFAGADNRSTTSG